MYIRKQFYNDAINELVDFSEDFSRWKDTQRCSFSFCAHPFVLDPGTKSKLLQVPPPRRRVFSLLFARMHPMLMRPYTATNMLLVACSSTPTTKCGRRYYSLYLLHWCKCANADANTADSRRALPQHLWRQRVPLSHLPCAP
jgi:hypothetical protein